MNWPTHADYQEAVQNPKHCFKLPELTSGTVAETPLGLPRVMSGNFASVYEVRSEQKTFAVRCFVRQVTNQQTRYAVLSRCLQPLALPFLVPFEFVNEGIRVHDRWYPIVKMDWVSGLPLHQFIERNQKDSILLLRLAMAWRELLLNLRAHRVAHCDLQHGNVLVTPQGELWLVDYDGMYAPAFAREKSPELGHINYQHPRRAADFFDENVDNFSALVIHIALLAVAAEPELWNEFHTGDNLLLTSADFKKPGASKLVPRLMASTDERVPRLTQLLLEFAGKPATQVPDLETVTVTLVKQVELKPLEVAPEVEGVSDNIEERPVTIEGSRPAARTRPADSPLDDEKIATRAAEPNPENFDTAFWEKLRRLKEKFGEEAVGTMGSREARGRLNPWAVLALILALFSFPKELNLMLGIPALIAVFIAWRRQKVSHEVSNWLMFMAVLAALGSVMAGAVVRLKQPDDRAARRPSTFAPGDPAGTNGLAPAGEVPLSVSAEGSPESPRNGWDTGAPDITASAWGEGGLSVALGHGDGRVELWSVVGGRSTAVSTNLSTAVQELRFVSDEGVPRLRALDAESRILWLSVPGLETQREERVAADSFFPAAISPDGNWLASGLEDRRRVRIAPVDNPEGATELGGFSSWIKNVHFTADSLELVVVCLDDTIHLAGVPDGLNRRSVGFPDAGVERVALSDRERLLAAASRAGVIRLWDTASGSFRFDALMPAGTAKALAFSVDDRWLITGTSAGQVCFWNTKNGRQHPGLMNAGSPVTHLNMAPDGQSLMVATADGRVSIWDAGFLNTVLQRSPF